MNLYAWLDLLRPVNALMTGLGVAVGYFLASGSFPIKNELGLAMLAAMLVAGGGMAINDYFDRFIDAKIKTWRPIPSGQIKAWHALLVSLILFGGGIYTASLINETCFLIAGFASFLLILYSAYLAKLPLLGNIAIALNTGLTFIFGEAAATGQIFSLNLTILFALAFLSTFAREIYKDIEDVPGDKGIRKTMPMIIGPSASSLIASIAIIISVIASPVPYLMGTLKFPYLLGLSIADLLFIYIAFASVIKGKIYSTELKIAQLIGLISFLLGL